MKPPRRQLVIVSGAPGAGKTTLAAPLAQALRFPLFSKDFIKETLTDVLGDAAGDLSASRRIGGAAMELMWSLAARTPQAVLEANFRPKSDYERARLTALDARIIEVHCDCGLDVAAERFRRRAAEGIHAAHPLKEMPAEWLAEYDGPVGLGEVISVDTRQPVDIAALSARIERAWTETPDKGAVR